MRKVYDGWKYPEDWVVGGFALEGPKVVKHGEYYYMVVAEGGTAGPPTSHMVVAARARSLEGPWQNSPHNPIVHTRSGQERWWSKGHGTLFEGPAGQWYLVYHAYENGFYTLGRQTLLEPVIWTDDGWFKSAGYDVARPIPKPHGERVAGEQSFSDDFASGKLGLQWSFHRGGSAADGTRYRFEKGALVVEGRGESPKDCGPLTLDAGDQSYEVEVEIEIAEGARAGLILFYNEKLYAGLGFDGTNLIRHRYGKDTLYSRPKGATHTLQLRLRNERNVVSLFYKLEGQDWRRFEQGMEVSGYHHNVIDEFLSLRPALYAAGRGEVRFRHFKYRGLQ
jgi:beta-xylosidase